MGLKVIGYIAPVSHIPQVEAPISEILTSEYEDGNTDGNGTNPITSEDGNADLATGNNLDVKDEPGETIQNINTIYNTCCATPSDEANINNLNAEEDAEDVGSPQLEGDGLKLHLCTRSLQPEIHRSQAQ